MVTGKLHSLMGLPVFRDSTTTSQARFCLIYGTPVCAEHERRRTLSSCVHVAGSPVTGVHTINAAVNVLSF